MLIKIGGSQPIALKLKRVEDIYNTSEHRGIQCSPEEAWKTNTEELFRRNSREGEYAKTFKRRNRETFKEGEQVRETKLENLGVKSKSQRGRDRTWKEQ
jgi:hypothetical protein